MLLKLINPAFYSIIFMGITYENIMGHGRF